MVSDTEPELNPWSNGDAVCVEEEWVATFSGQTGDQPEENTPHLSSSKGQLENFKPNSLFYNNSNLTDGGNNQDFG